MKTKHTAELLAVVLLIVGAIPGLAQKGVSSPASAPVALGDTNQRLSVKKVAKLKQNPVSGMREMFDWRQLRRWNISEASLPPGSIVQFRPPAVWEHHKDYVIGGFCMTPCADRDHRGVTRATRPAPTHGNSMA